MHFVRKPNLIWISTLPYVLVFLALDSKSSCLPEYSFPWCPLCTPCQGHPRGKSSPEKAIVLLQKKEKGIFQRPPAQRRPVWGCGLSRRVPAARLPSQSYSAFCPAPLSCWQRRGREWAQQKTANANDAPKSMGCLPKSAARCLLFKLLNIFILNKDQYQIHGLHPCLRA